MAVNSSRRQTQSLLEGATDGKYRKVRPDTEVTALGGYSLTLQDRQHLHPWWNYGEIAKQAPLQSMAVPGR